MKIASSLVVSMLSLASPLALAQNDAPTKVVTDDATMARLRVSNCVFGGPDVDVYVNGEVAVNGGVPQTNVRTPETWGYLYLSPDTYSISLVPAGMGLDQALLGPTEVRVEAGHRYTLVALGQVDEPSHEPLVIDETAAYQAIGAKPTDTAHITVNNVRGAAGIDFKLDDIVREGNVRYGEFQAALWPTGSYTGLELAMRNDAGEVVVSDGFTGEGGNWPATDSLDCVGGTLGTVGQDWTNATSMYESSLSAVDFLEEVSSTEYYHSFDTFLSALETAGLTETLVAGDPFLLYVPTDEAFAALPKDQLDALMADPQAMADLLRYHIVEGYYPYGNMPGVSVPGQLVVTNLQGTNLAIGDDGTINGVAIEQVEHAMVRNGTRVKMIAQVLMPPE